MPPRPSWRSAAHAAKPRARRDDSGTKSPAAHRVAARPDEIRRRVGQRRRVGRGVRAEREARVVRDVQPLVAVAAPRVGPLDAVDQMPRAAGWRRPQPERAVDVHPRAVRAGDVAMLATGRRTRRCSRCRPGGTRSSGPAGPAASTRARSSRSMAPLTSAATGSSDVGAEAEQPQRPVERPRGARRWRRSAPAARRQPFAARRPSRRRPARGGGPRPGRPCWRPALP